MKKIIICVMLLILFIISTWFGIFFIGQNRKRSKLISSELPIINMDIIKNEQIASEEKKSTSERTSMNFFVNYDNFKIVLDAENKYEWTSIENKDDIKSFKKCIGKEIDIFDIYKNSMFSSYIVIRNIDTLEEKFIKLECQYAKYEIRPGDGKVIFGENTYKYFKYSMDKSNSGEIGVTSPVLETNSMDGGTMIVRNVLTNKKTIFPIRGKTVIKIAYVKAGIEINQDDALYRLEEEGEYKEAKYFINLKNLFDEIIKEQKDKVIYVTTETARWNNLQPEKFIIAYQNVYNQYYRVMPQFDKDKQLLTLPIGEYSKYEIFVSPKYDWYSNPSWYKANNEIMDISNFIDDASKYIFVQDTSTPKMKIWDIIIENKYFGS